MQGVAFFHYYLICLCHTWCDDACSTQTMEGRQSLCGVMCPRNRM